MSARSRSAPRFSCCSAASKGLPACQLECFVICMYFSDRVKLKRLCRQHALEVCTSSRHGFWKKPPAATHSQGRTATTGHDVLLPVVWGRFPTPGTQNASARNRHRPTSYPLGHGCLDVGAWGPGQCFAPSLRGRRTAMRKHSHAHATAENNSEALAAPARAGMRDMAHPGLAAVQILVAANFLMRSSLACLFCGGTWKMLPHGLEPWTSRVLAERSNQLSYESRCLGTGMR